MKQEKQTEKNQALEPGAANRQKGTHTLISGSYAVEDTKPKPVQPAGAEIWGREQIYRGNLLLVNQQYPYKGRRTENLVPVDARFPGICLRLEAANALRLIFKKIISADAIVPVSGYRSLEEQTDIYRTSLEENGEDFTRQYVALPNHSEHQTGLAIDLGLNQNEIDFIRPDFPYNGICEKFREAAPGYGFIERYAKEKEQITGISHEPWHFRYIGYPHSEIVSQHGFALEEYIDFLRGFREGCRYAYSGPSGGKAEIYFVPVEDGRARADKPKAHNWQISGNNVDGFIVTEIFGSFLSLHGTQNKI